MRKIHFIALGQRSPAGKPTDMFWPTKPPKAWMAIVEKKKRREFRH